MKVTVDQMADAIMEGLEEYNQLAASTVKKAVKRAGTTVRKEIEGTAPQMTGKYAKSWRSKTTAESASSIHVTVYSPSRYMLAHLLEHGHALRNGGRTRAFPHIAPVEEIGDKQLETDIIRGLKDG